MLIRHPEGLLEAKVALTTSTIATIVMYNFRPNDQFLGSESYVSGGFIKPAWVCLLTFNIVRSKVQISIGVEVWLSLILDTSRSIRLGHRP